MISGALAIKECQRQNPITDIPCMVITSYHPSGNCSEYNATIYFNLTTIKNLTYGDYFPNCNITFNESQLGVYYWNSSIENGFITVIGDDNLLIALLLIPVAVMFMLIYWGNSLPEDQQPLKWFMRLFAFLMVIVVYIGAQIAISLNPAYSAFADIFNIAVVGIIFWGLIALFIMYFIFKLFMSFKEKKMDDLRLGRFR